MTKFLTHVKHNVVAYLALFVALGGTSYAAVNLPARSVGTKQLRNGAVTNAKLGKGAVGARKLDPSSIGGYVRAYVRINPEGQITASRPAAKVVIWRTGTFDPGGTIQWSHYLSESCFAVASTELRGGTPTYANADLQSGGHSAVTYVSLSAPAQPVNIAVICPGG